MAGKLFNVFAIAVFLGVFALAAQGASKGVNNQQQLKKKTSPLKNSDDDEFMFADQPGSGDGEDTDNESNPPIDETDPDYSIDGSPDINELLPEEEIDIDTQPQQRPPVQSPATVRPPCQAGRPCQSANPTPCRTGRPCQAANPSPCQSGRPCQAAKPQPCRTGRPCPSVRPPPCQSGRRCQSARRPCQSKRTCHSRRPCQSTKRPCPSPALPAPILPPAFSPTKVCGQTLYCRKGYRGPCHRNEIFTPVPSVISRPIQPTCPAVVSRQIGCISSPPKIPFPVTSSSPGYCTIRYPQKPCFGYPSTYRFCKQTKQCYPVTTMPPVFVNRKRQAAPSPCPPDQFFTAVSSSYGFCRCSRPNYLRCQKTNRCYPAYTKGTCSQGQWMVPFGNQGLSTCKTCPCPSQADGRHIYVSGKQYQKPGCYKSQTRGPCQPGMRFVIGNILTGSSRCVPNNSGLRKRPNSGYNTLMKDWNLFYGGMTR